MRCPRSLHNDAPLRVSQGYTLLELMAVVTIVSVLAAVVLPGFRPADDDRLELAAARVAEALRFARTESIRTGEVHAVEILFDTEQLIVSETDMTKASPYPAATPTDPASIRIHPITKQPFAVDFSQTLGVDVLMAPFSYATGDQRAVLFNAQGMPFFKTAGTFYLLDEGLVQLELAGRQRNVRLAAMTGRVSIE